MLRWGSLIGWLGWWASPFSAYRHPPSTYCYWWDTGHPMFPWPHYRSWRPIDWIAGIGSMPPLAHRLSSPPQSLCLCSRWWSIDGHMGSMKWWYYSLSSPMSSSISCLSCSVYSSGMCRCSGCTPTHPYRCHSSWSLRYTVRNQSGRWHRVADNLDRI